MKQLYIFKSPNWAQAEKVFTHFWTNEGENFFDTVWQTTDDNGHHVEYETTEGEIGKRFNYNPTEAYLYQFIDQENGYDWVPIDVTRYQRRDISSISVQMTAEDFQENPSLFFKLVDIDEETGMQKDIPLYYYSDKITEASDQNYERTSYTVVCNLDMWATFWCRMHSIMKKCPTDIDFMQKMADRFIFNEQFDKDGNRIDSQGFIIDYLKQPYLMRSGKYPTQLVVNDDRENFLTLEQWLFINSGKQDSISYEDWLSDTWLKWLQTPWVGCFSPKVYPETKGAPSFNPEDFGKYQNNITTLITNGFYDSDFNSNGKYRYLVCKVGNNTLPSMQTEGKPKGMFTNPNFGITTVYPKTKVLTSGHTISKTDLWKQLPGISRYSYAHEVNLGNINLKSGAMCAYWDNWFINQKYMTFKIDAYLNSYSTLEPIKVGTYYVTWTDSLQEKIGRKIIENFTTDKEYTIIDLPAKSYAFDIYGDYVNVNLNIAIKFTTVNDQNVKATLIFTISFDRDYQVAFSKKGLILDIHLSENATINSFYLSQEAGNTSSLNNQQINGETLMIIPFKKGKEEQDYLKMLNAADAYANTGMNMGDGSVIGMPINDIPPSVLALAIRRQNDVSLEQTIGDMLSVRHSNGINCPVSLVNLHTNYTVGEDSMTKDIPSIFTSFDNVPVVVARAPLRDNIYQCVGGNKFFNYYFDILTNNDLTTNSLQFDPETLEPYIRGGNCIEAEPFLYGPQFWKWSYFIDGNHIIELTGDKLDFTKLMLNQEWEVRLNTTFGTSGTGYYLDITDIKNDKYPMSKLGIELISGDPATFPYTTEAYNDWIQTNVATQETSKNAKDIANRYARTGAIIEGTSALISTTAELTAQAASGGTLFSKGAGVAIGATMGLTAGAAKMAGIIVGAENSIAQANEEWENKWRGELGNMYNSPSSLNANGFSSGSLIYSMVKQANQNSYELFRTFSLSDIDKEHVWHDISMNGYPYLSQCLYKDYNNRLNFNIVNCNLYDKQYLIINFLKQKMFEVSPLLSQEDAVKSFCEKCRGKFRVFKCDFDINNMDDIVNKNIELVREWVRPYYAPKRNVTLTLNHHQWDHQDNNTSWFTNNYDIVAGTTEKTYIVTKKNSTTYSDNFDYDLFDCNNWTEFKTKFQTLSLGNRNSAAGLKRKNIVDDTFEIWNETISVNNVDFGPESLPIDSDLVKGFIDSITTNQYLDKAIFITKNGKTFDTSSYKLGWNVTLSDAEISSEEHKVRFTFTPVSQWTFTNVDEDITTGASINNLEVPAEPIKKYPCLMEHISVDKIYPFDEKGKPGTGSLIFWDNRWMNYYNNRNEEKWIESNYEFYKKEYCAVILWMPSNIKSQKFYYKNLPYKGIKTKEDFRKYYKKIEFNTNGKIYWNQNWPLDQRDRGKKQLIAENQTIQFDIPQSSDTAEYKIGLSIGELDNKKENGPLWYKVKKVREYLNINKMIAYQDDTNLKKSCGGHAEYGNGRAWSNSEYGVYFIEGIVKIQLYDDYFEIKLEEKSCFGGQGNIGTTASSSWQIVVDDGLNNYPDACYITFGRDHNIDDLNSEFRLENVSLIGGEIGSAPSRWNMDNSLNLVVCFRQDEDGINRYILNDINKKEGV